VGTISIDVSPKLKKNREKTVIPQRLAPNTWKPLKEPVAICDLRFPRTSLRSRWSDYNLGLKFGDFPVLPIAALPFLSIKNKNCKKKINGVVDEKIM
jgi:hypothetical protein